MDREFLFTLSQQEQYSTPGTLCFALVYIHTYNVDKSFIRSDQMVPTTDGAENVEQVSNPFDKKNDRVYSSSPPSCSIDVVNNLRSELRSRQVRCFPYQGLGAGSHGIPTSPNPPKRGRGSQTKESDSQQNCQPKVWDND